MDKNCIICGNPAGRSPYHLSDGGRICITCQSAIPLPVRHVLYENYSSEKTLRIFKTYMYKMNHFTPTRQIGTIHEKEYDFCKTKHVVIYRMEIDEPNKTFRFIPNFDDPDIKYGPLYYLHCKLWHHDIPKCSPIFRIRDVYDSFVEPDFGKGYAYFHLSMKYMNTIYKYTYTIRSVKTAQHMSTYLLFQKYGKESLPEYCPFCKSKLIVDKYGSCTKCGTAIDPRHISQYGNYGKINQTFDQYHEDPLVRFLNRIQGNHKENWF